MMEEYISPIFIQANKERQVVRISFNNPDVFFNSIDMSPDDFAQSFAQAYKIPNYSPAVMRKVTVSYWDTDKMIEVPMEIYKYGVEYSDPASWKVVILYPDKEVTLQIIPKPNQRNFD